MTAGDTEVLRALGLSPDACTVYPALLRLPGEPAQRIAGELGMGTSRAQRALEELAGRSLARPVPGPSGRFLPTPPETMLTTLIYEQEAELARVSATVEDLMATYRGATPGRPYEVVKGRDVVSARFNELQDSADDELLIFDTPPYTAPQIIGGREEEENQCRVLHRGVRCRTLYSLAAVQIPGRLGCVWRLGALGDAARVLPDLPTKLVIADGATALLPLSTSADRVAESALLLRSEPFVVVLRALFDHLWEQAVALAPPAPREDLSDAEARLVQMLAAGLRDAAIARELGVTPGTVRRKITNLLERLGASSRFEAGVRAVERRWL